MHQQSTEDLPFSVKWNVDRIDGKTAGKTSDTIVWDKTKNISDRRGAVLDQSQVLVRENDTQNIQTLCFVSSRHLLTKTFIEQRTFLGL